MQERNGNAERGTFSNLAFAGVLATLVLLVFYVLSLGPAVWLVENHYLSEATLVVIYYPLLTLSDACTPISIALGMYIDLFVS